MTPRRVLAVGVFDLFHVGHLRYLQYAREQGRVLVVAVSTDAVSVSAKKKLPIIPELERLEIVRGLGWVDEAALQPCSTEETDAAAVWIASWQIDHVVAGGGWEGSARWARLIPALAQRGISVSFAPETKGLSTTLILERIRQGGTT
ncbi:MAG: adenylyltransferase/cytidyltransferase family protein [Proteobacteria bacterium]|nr:adenylyltransferase/cytidyltransferase family protein [Pseudomonadota bacterium]